MVEVGQGAIVNYAHWPSDNPDSFGLIDLW